MARIRKSPRHMKDSEIQSELNRLKEKETRSETTIIDQRTDPPSTYVVGGLGRSDRRLVIELIKEANRRKGHGVEG